MSWLHAHPYADFALLILVYALCSALGSKHQGGRHRLRVVNHKHDYAPQDCGPRCCPECRVCGREHA
jgi:hypothetical protein